MLSHQGFFCVEWRDVEAAMVDNEPSSLYLLSVFSFVFPLFSFLLCFLLLLLLLHFIYQFLFSVSEERSDRGGENKGRAGGDLRRRKKGGESGENKRE